MTNENSNVDASILEKFKKCSGWATPAVDEEISKAKETAKTEATRTEIFCNEDGLTQDMSNICTTHACDALRSFQHTYSAFMAAITPYIDKIKEVSKLEERYANIDKGVHLKIKDEKAVLDSDPKFEKASAEASEADARYQNIRKKEGNRDVRNPSPIWYILLLFCVGGLEVALNYNFLLEFMGVPAFAFGASAMAGGIVAWAAHEHGKAIKQHNFYFGSHVRPEDKISIRWQFVASTTCLFVAFIAIYFSRYIAVSNAHQAILNASGFDILGGGTQDFAIGPAWAALVSLLFNILVWGVSVWVATGFHDSNPHYMDAHNQLKRAERRLAKVTKTYNASVRAHSASLGVERQSVRNELQAMTEDLGQHLVLFRQVQEKRASVIKALTNDTNKILAVYKRVLIETLDGNGEVHIYDDANQPLPVEQYRKQAVAVHEAQIKNLIHW